MNFFRTALPATCLAILLAQPISAAAAEPPIPSPTTTNEVLVDVLRVRETPSLDGAILTNVKKGTRVVVLQRQGEWSLVAANEITGWVANSYIGTEGSTAKRHVVSTVENLSLRDEPSVTGAVVGVIEKGKAYELVQEKYGWKKIRWNGDTEGWVAGYFTTEEYRVQEETEQVKEQTSSAKKETVTVLHDGTNLRAEATTNGKIVSQARAGETFPVVGRSGDWVQVAFGDRKVYVADWVVTLNDFTPSSDAPLVVLDPGHGGRDNGATGYKGTLEKLMTLQTSLRVKQKLEADGYEVELTRTNDYYVSLYDRVAHSNNSLTDLFLSFHYDSVEDPSAHGHTTYYYHDKDRSISQIVHDSISETVDLHDREVRFGDYYVLRENLRPAVLLELGYLSNVSDEGIVTHRNFQELVSTAITEGIKEALPYEEPLLAQQSLQTVE